MAEPARKPNSEIDPTIRPNLRVVDGGGETTPDRANLKAADPSGASELDQREKKGNVTVGPWEGSGIKDAEEEAANADGWATKLSGSKPARKAKLLGLITKKRGVTAGILFLLGFGGAGAGFLGMTLAPLAFLDPIVNDLNDQLAALDTRDEHLLRNKIPSEQRDRALTGCTKLSIRCKFTTISKTQYTRLQTAGITVSPAPNDNVFSGRVRPQTYSFRGTDYSPAEFSEALKTNNALKTAYKRANNMKLIGFSDKTFVGRVLKKYNLSKKTELKGNYRDKVNQLMTQARVENVEELRFTLFETDEEGDPRYVLEGDESGRTYSEAEVEKLQTSIDRVQAVSKPPSRLGSAAIKGLSVLGYWDLACSVKNMIGGASVAAKIANSASLAQYAFPVASLISQWKAGDLSDQDTQVLQEFLLKPDARAQITDPQRLFNTGSPVEDIFPFNGSEGLVDNPDYGRNAMDASLYQMSRDGGVASSSAVRSHYSLGLGQNLALAGISGFAAVVDVLVNVGGQNNEICNIVQNWAVRGVGLIAGLALAGASGGTSLAIQGAVFAGMFTVMIILDGVINGALSGSIIPDDIDDASVDRGQASWTGLAVIFGESAKARGMMPGSAEQIVAYNQLSDDVNQTYIALEQQDVHPFDTSSPHSFVGSLSLQLASVMPSSFSVSSVIGSAATIVTSGFGSIIQPAKSLADTIDTTRFKQCDDSAYNDVGIDADVQCNIRYVMPTADLNLDTDDVALWMETVGCGGGCVARDTTTGFPEGYTPPDPEESQGFAMDMLNGVANTFYDTRAADVGEGYNEYAKFLDYCAYRAMPFGETYEEGGATGDDDGWKTGKKCMENSTQLQNFRIYTLDKSLVEGVDAESTSTASLFYDPSDETYSLDDTVASNSDINPTADDMRAAAFLSLAQSVQSLFGSIKGMFVSLTDNHQPSLANLTPPALPSRRLL